MMNSILQNFTYGLYALSCGDYICVVDTAMQVSSVNSDDVYIAVSINKNSDTGNLIKEGENFAVSVLVDYTPKDIVQQLGSGHSSEMNKFKGLEYIMLDGVTIPYEYCLGTLVCHPVNIIDCGSHNLIVGKVIDYKEFNEDLPLTYQQYKDL